MVVVFVVVIVGEMVVAGVVVAGVVVAGVVGAVPGAVAVSVVGAPAEVNEAIAY